MPGISTVVVLVVGGSRGELIPRERYRGGGRRSDVPVRGSVIEQIAAIWGTVHQSPFQSTSL